MIRVGFVMAGGHAWVGGLNYLSNLLNSVMQLPERRIEPVLIVPPDMDRSTLRGFPAVETLVTPLVRARSKPWLVRKVLTKALRRDVLLERFLRRHRIDVLSHADHLGRCARLRTICWIPDFQHRRLPDFFQPEELAARDRGFLDIARNCSTLVLSSRDAQSDLAAFAPAFVSKSRVLNFVSGVGGGATPTDLAALEAKYGFHGPYLHLPNQYWAHKNHGLVIEALGLLQARGRPVLVLSTGHTKDPRQPGHFERLMARVAELGVVSSFRALGLVPYEDMLGLMHHSAAVVNPSLFEGWSTTVEESKSLGKTIVLSDIPVHREQAPAFGLFFDPASAADLADAMEKAFNGWRPQDEVARRQEAQAQLRQRFADFGRCYQEIVMETCDVKN